MSITRKTIKDSAQSQPPEQGFLVGIGASAGGLEALTALLKALSADLGAAYVVVQHLSPTYR